MKAPSRPLIIALAAVLVVAVAATAVFVLKPDAFGAVGLSLSGATDEVTATDAQTVAQDPAPKAESSETAGGSGVDTGGTNGTNRSNTGGTTGGTGGAGGSNQSGGGTDQNGGTGGDTGASTVGLTVRVLWWNDAKAKPADGFEIVYDSKSIKPDTSKASGTGSIGPVPFGKDVVLVVYPDGRDGKRFEVPFKVSKTMAPNSDVDAIHVEVSDDKVRVLGNAVDNFDQSYARF